MKKIISVIVPCYNEEESVPLFYKEIQNTIKVLAKYKFELLFIDDGSKDKTLKKIVDIAEKDKAVKYISFSRNFGKESAIYAGLKNASGDFVVMMDADLQDPPRLLPDMLSAIEEEGYDSVATRRVSRKGEPPLRSLFARLFYKLMNKISKTEIISGARDYRLMTRKFVNAILELSEYNRFSKGLFGWVGFKTKWIEFENVERIAGSTKWSFCSLTKYAIDGIVAFSEKPLVFSAIIGMFVTLSSFAGLIFIIIRKIMFGDPVAGWASTICIVLFLSGIQILCIGILGEYLAKTYLEVKNRPIYICAKTNIDEENQAIKRTKN